VDVGITSDASLRSGSEIKLNEGSTFTVAEGKTFAVENGATVDFSDIGTTIPTTAADAPVKINGAIELASGGTFNSPNPGLFSSTSATDIYKFVSFGSGGKIVLNQGAIYEFSEVPATASAALIPAVPFIGTASAAFTWNTTSDGAQIIIDGTGLTIRDTDAGGAEVTVAAPSAYILKEQTLYLDTGVELKFDNNEGIWFAGDAAGGAQLKGPGKIIAGATEITGGSSGWRVVGTETIGIFQYTADTATIMNVGTGTTTSFEALGPGAIITQKAVANNDLTIEVNTIVDLNGTATSPGGSIVLKADTTDYGTLTFAAANSSKVLLGAGTGGTAITAALSSSAAIGGKGFTTTLAVGNFTVLDNRLVVLGGAGAGGTIAPNTVSTSSVINDVVIVSNAPFTP
jgi:hypothetical protein